MNIYIKVGSKVVYRVPPKDLRIETFKGSGPGGQNRNKRETAVRIIHVPSSSIGQSQDERSQAQNKKKALNRLVETSSFKAWARTTAAMIAQGYSNIDQKIDRLLKEENLKVEFFDPEEE